MNKVDLHIHSKYSDGSDSIPELLENIKAAGLEVFSLTDHDTIGGYFEIKDLVLNDLKYIQGVELTCATESFKCHILGYGYKPDDKGLFDLIEKGKAYRKRKLDTRIDYLKNVHGIEFTQEELDWLNSRASVVKTHLACLLVKRNLASDNVSAMKKYLDNIKTGNTKFDAKEAIDVLLNANAIVVWAHPLGGEGEVHISKEEFYKRLELMKSLGIQGLECHYSRYNKEEREFLEQCAKENNLLVSGGSDYHGNNKIGIELGKLDENYENVDTSRITLLNKF